MSPAKVIASNPNLPSAYPHTHSSEEARQIALDGTLLRVQVGSAVHGTSIDVASDRDELGICCEPAEFVTGTSRVPSGSGATQRLIDFEQFERHTAWDRPGGVKNRSGVGDLDVTIYSARKWARLALGGNPTVLVPLFTPDSDVMVRNAVGADLVDNAHRFVSRRAAGRFLGYLTAQRDAMLGLVGAHTNRPELVAQHGFDTKYAAQAARLGIQGVEMLTTGRITLPMLPDEAAFLRAVRRGEVPLDDVLANIAGNEARLVQLRESTDLPDGPDTAWVNGWLHRAYTSFWAGEWGCPQP